MWIQFTATRRVASTHTVGNVYTLDFCVSSYLEKDNILFNENRSLNGNIERVLTRDDLTYVIAPTNIKAADIEFWREALASMGDGQIVVYDNDYDSTFAAQVNPQNTKMVSKSFSFRHLSNVANLFSTTLELILI